MKIIKNGINKLVEQGITLGGGILGSQAPGMALEYEQTAKSMLYESQQNIHRWEDLAEKLGERGVEGLLRAYEIAGDSLSIGTGEKLQSDIQRVQDLAEVVTELANTALLQKPLVALSDAIMSSTGNEVIRVAADNYEAVIPLNMENAVYGLGSAALAFIAYNVIKRVGKRKKQD